MGICTYLFTVQASNSISTITDFPDFSGNTRRLIYAVSPESIDPVFAIEAQNACFQWLKTVPEIIDPVFAKTSQNARFLLSENERFGLVFVKTGSINSGTGVLGLFSRKRGSINLGTRFIDTLLRLHKSYIFCTFRKIWLHYYKSEEIYWLFIRKCQEC